MTLLFKTVTPLPPGGIGGSRTQLDWQPVAQKSAVLPQKPNSLQHTFSGHVLPAGVTLQVSRLGSPKESSRESTLTWGVGKLSTLGFGITLRIAIASAKGRSKAARSRISPEERSAASHSLAQDTLFAMVDVVISSSPNQLAHVAWQVLFLDKSKPQMIHRNQVAPDQSVVDILAVVIRQM